jgi:hypothetical protein
VFGDLTWWNGECYLENIKNGVQSLSQFVKDMKSMCTFKTLLSCAQISESFADIRPAQTNFKLNCMVPWLSGVKNHIARNYPNLWHAGLH